MWQGDFSESSKGPTANRTSSSSFTQGSAPVVPIALADELGVLVGSESQGESVSVVGLSTAKMNPGAVELRKVVSSGSVYPRAILWSLNISVLLTSSQIHRTHQQDESRDDPCDDWHGFTEYHLGVTL